MEDISQFKSREEWENFIWKKFLEKAQQVDSRKHLKEFLNNILSASEKKLIVKRLVAVALLKERKTYREIGKILWISPGTLSAIKKSLWQNAEYQSERHYNKKSSDEKRKKIKGLPPRTIFDYWLNFPFPTKTGKGRWKFLNYQG